MVLPKLMMMIVVECQLDQRRKPSYSPNGGCHADAAVDLGLRLLTQTANYSKAKSNVLVKSALRKAAQTSNIIPFPADYCFFLKTCNLCNKQLSPDKDTYMYRGDQGFCSVECRNRQIVLDEMKELESSTKQMAASYGYRHCSNDANRETRLILKDLISQRLKSEKIPCNQNHYIGQ